MLYNFSNVVNKSADWKIASIRGADGSEHHEVSINRTNKRNEVFPRFDEIANGAQIEGNYWQSPQGKGYLFAPKVPQARSGGGNSVAIAAAQERKAEHISNAMDKKEWAIKVSGTARDATLITVELLKQDPLAEWHVIWERTREKLWNMYEKEISVDDIY